MPTVLLVDDDPSIRDVVCFALEKDAYEVVQAENGAQALELFAAQSPDLLILDILMPEMDGTEVCRRIRQSSSVPIIFLSSRDEEIDRVLGLELGGDDYVTKPFSPRELMARVRAILRRGQPSGSAASTGAVGEVSLSHGKLRLDGESFKAYWGEAEVVLTLTEFGILRTLMGRPQKVFTRDDFMESAYESARFVSDRTIDSHVRRVRRKFGMLDAAPIETVHGMGYKLGPCT